MKIPVRNSMVNNATASLRDAILASEFQHQLPGVRTLSEDLHVSIPTILGAIRALEIEGLLRTQPGKRATILPRKSRTLNKKAHPPKVVFLGFTQNWTRGSLYYQNILSELTRLGVQVRSYDCETKNWRTFPANLEEIATNQEIDCWILLGAPAVVQQTFAERQLPCILDGIAIEGTGLHDFEVDFDALYRHAVNHLVLKGHRRIALLTSVHSAHVNPGSIKAFREAWLERVPNEPAWDPIQTYGGSKEQFESLLRNCFFGKKPAPTALVIASVFRLATGMTWLMKNGLRIPEDVSILSRDHDDFLDALYPTPSHYRQPESAPKRFVRAVLAIIDKKHTRDHTRIMTEFVEGETIQRI